VAGAASGTLTTVPVAVVTGATGGIGRWIALGLAQAGHDVVLVGRSQHRGDDTLAWIAARAPGARLEFYVADLASLAATRLVAERIVVRAPAIDVLVNNAGVFCTRREETPEGHERVIAVNHLAPFVLTRALLPALSSAPRARIVNIGSSTSDRARIDPADLAGKRRWGMVHAYSQSKLALMMATFGWALRLHGTSITANVVHPGLVATGLVRASGVVGWVWRGMAPFVLTAEQGADTPLHVALSAEFAGISGSYVKRRRVVPPNRRALDAGLVEQVWRATEALVGF
jgi:NAD(P)-dependent dehydrogenase (short-subunit alcohol dehydrogenase family)